MGETVKILRTATMLAGAAGSLLLATPSWAGDQPLYEAAPAWIDGKEADAALAKTGTSKATLVVMDRQTRIEKGKLWNYTDMVYRIDSPEALSQGGMIQGMWNPDLGDLIVHKVEILRGNERIDALAGGRKFEILRREAQLSQLQVTGVLTAMLQVEGLRMGDRVRYVSSTTYRDPATGNDSAHIAPIVAAPAMADFARTRIIWPASENLRWKVTGKNINPLYTPASGNGMNSLVIREPVSKQPDQPALAPMRYMVTALVEVSGFADWKAVSRASANHYRTAGLIADGSALALEADKIAKATRDPKMRAAQALELVQREVRYLFNGMGNGNYVPQSPAKTWELRYGDCKAKTLLLLALLHRLDIEAVPALVNATGKDSVAERLPAFGAFDHVIVRAVIDGKTYWLDGTKNDDRLTDLENVPDFGYALPSTEAGADLERLAFRPNARMDEIADTSIDMRAGLYVPAVIKVRKTVRGELLGMLRLAKGSMDKEMFDALVSKALQPNDLSSIVRSSIRFDDAAGTALLEGEGLYTVQVQSKGPRRILPIDTILADFKPDAPRNKTEWKDIPFAPPNIGYRQRITRLLLPAGGKGFTVDNGTALNEQLAGYKFARSVKNEAASVTLDETVQTVALEQPYDRFLVDKGRIGQINARPVELVIAADYPESWAERRALKDSAALAPVVAVYDSWVAKDKDDTHALQNRASFYEGVKDYKKAEGDLDRLIALEPSADHYSWRSYLRMFRDLKAAEPDARKALELDPGHLQATGNLVEILVRAGKFDAIPAVLDHWEANGAPEIDLTLARAMQLDESGKPDEALAMLDRLNEQKPGTPGVLNSLCWVKGRNNLDLPGALKQCTKAIELADNPVAFLDSRGLIYYRMQRYDDAVADYDAALRIDNSLAVSYVMRGLAKRGLGQEAAAAADIATARGLDPYAITEVTRMGLKP